MNAPFSFLYAQELFSRAWTTSKNTSRFPNFHSPNDGITKPTFPHFLINY